MRLRLSLLWRAYRRLLACALRACGHRSAQRVPGRQRGEWPLQPTAMQFAPDGRLFVAQQGGQLRVIKNGVLLSTPFVSLTVNSTGERGLLGIAFDPNFASNQFVYLFYTATTPSIHNRISRFTANGDVANTAVSEVVILDFDNLSAHQPQWRRDPFRPGWKTLCGPRRQRRREQCADTEQPARQGHPHEPRTDPPHRSLPTTLFSARRPERTGSSGHWDFATRLPSAFNRALA